MFMEKLRDIVMRAFPAENLCVVDSATQDGIEWFMKQYETVHPIRITGEEVNEFMDKLREIGLSFSFKLA